MANHRYVCVSWGGGGGGGDGRVVELFLTRAKKQGLLGTVYVQNVVMSCRVVVKCETNICNHVKYLMRAI